MVTSFQFHKGAIRTISRMISIVLLIDFNSIKVRLEHSQVMNMTSTPKFQFHKGAIRTPIVLEFPQPY